MNFSENWARVFVAIIFLGFGEEQVIESEVQNLIALGVFLGAVGYFTFGEKMDKFPDKRNYLNEKNINQNRFKEKDLLALLQSIKTSYF